MSGAYDDLYEAGNNHGWWARLTPEAKDWLVGLADHIRANGEPVWTTVHKTMESLFPDDCPKSVTTIRDTLRREVLRG